MGRQPRGRRRAPARARAGLRGADLTAVAPAGDRAFDGRFAREELAPGVRLHLAPSRKFKTVVVKAFLRADLARASATSTALLPYVLRHGSRRLPGMRAVNQALEALYGTRLGVDVLKLGEQQVLCLRLDLLGDAFLPAGAGVLAPATALLADLLLDPARDGPGDPGAGALAAGPVALERETLRRHLEGLKDDKAGYAAERCVRAMCADEPYGVYEYGALEDLPGVDGAALEARRRALLAGAPVDLYVAGAFDPAAARDVLAAAFAPLCATRRAAGDAGSAPAPLRGTTPHPPPAGSPREVREPAEARQARLVLGLRAGGRLGDPGYWPHVVLNGVLGAFPHSKLFKNVRERAGLCYDAGSSFERLKGLLFMSCGIDASAFAQARDLCLEQLAAIGRGELTDDELEATRLAFAQGYRSLLDAPGQLAQFDYVLRLGGLDVTPEDAVAAVAAVDRDAVAAAARGVRLDTVFLLEPEAPPAGAAGEPADLAAGAAAPGGVA